MRVLFLALLSPVISGAQGDTLRSAPISNVRYEITFDTTQAAARRIDVGMTFDVRSTRPVLLSIPVWTPGSYEIRNFAKYIARFGASENGAGLQWDKVDPDTWRVRPARAGSVTVKFEVRADTLENASAWTRADFAFFNGTNVFMYPEGTLDFASSVAVRTPAGWHVLSGLTGSSFDRSYTAKDYHDLVDHPFFVGKFDLDSTVIMGVAVRLASYPSHASSTAARTIAWDQLKRIFPAEVAVFGDAPWKSYSVMQVVDSTFPGAAALEHENSQLVIMSPEFLGSLSLGSLYAHETFHAWNVKRLRPAEMTPYRYDRSQPTSQLWISEGITDYYADLALVRGGVATVEQFLFLTLSKLQEVLTSDRDDALEDLSLSAWLSGTGGGNELYYPKGALAGLLLDIEIRSASNNRASLDDVMRELYSRSSKPNRGFTTDQWWTAVSRAAGGKSFADFYARYVDGRDKYPVDSLLTVAGFKLESTPIRIPRIGISLEEDSVGSKVFSVESGGPADKAGIKAGDYVVSLGGIPADAPDAVDQFARKYQRANDGVPVSVDVKRGTRILHLTAPLAFATRIIRQIIVDPSANAAAIAIREGLLHGTTQQ